MLVTDYIPPLRAIAADRRPRRAGGRRRAAGAPDPRRRARSTCSARRATSRPPATRPSARRRRCRGTRARRSTQRPAVVAAADRARCRPSAFAPFDPPIVVEDEIDLCLRWPDVPRPPSTAAPLPYPTVPTLILQGGEDLRTPPEVSARVAARIPGSVRIVVPGTGHSTVSDPRTCSRRRDRPLHRRQVAAEVPVQADPDRHPGRAGRAEVVRLAARLGRPAAQDRADRERAAARPSTTSGSSSRRPRWRPPAAACAAAPGRSSGNRLVLRATRLSTGVTRERQRQRAHHAARRGRQGGARRPSPCAPAGACPGRSAGAGSRCGSARRDVAAAKASQGAEVGALT